MDDRQDEASQLVMLVMLQEAGSYYRSGKTAYDAVESLKSAFGALKRANRYNAQSQTLVTMTTIILSHESADCAQLYELIELLVENVVQVKRNHPLVRAASCSCLREIELLYPGSLTKQLEQLWGTFGKDYTWACQALALLLVLGGAGPSTLMGAVSDENARSLHEASSLVGCIPLMTPVAAATMMRSLLASLADGLPPALLKLCCSHFSSCYELPLVHLMLSMQGEACKEAWWQELWLTIVEQLADSLHHPESWQALKVSWLGSVLRQQTIGQSLGPWHLLPTPRDDVTQQGLRLEAALAAGFGAWRGPEQMLGAMIPSVRCLKRHVRLAPGDFGIHLLLHVLYQLYADLRNTSAATSLTVEITRLVINMTLLGPLYCCSLLNFLKCVEAGFPQSALSQVVLMEAVDTVTEQSWEDPVQGSTVESCLLVLSAAVQKPGILRQPKQLFHFIQQLVATQGLSAQRTWALGNKLIDLCCSVMLHQTNHAVSSDLCTMLAYLSESPGDVDVKSRAKLLYAALSALSESKARQLLQSCSLVPALESEKGCNVLSDFPVPSTVACPTMEVLRLERMLTEGSQLQPCDQVPVEVSEHLSIAALQRYRAFLESEFDQVVHIPCRLFLESVEPQFDCLMGLQLNLAPPEDWGTAQGLEASVFWKNNSGVTTSVALFPQASVPCYITVRAEFTSLDSCSHVCWLEPLEVRFEDLLLPLPVPQPLPAEPQLSVDSYRAMLWHSLWEQLSGKDCLEVQTSSTLRLGPSPPSQQLWLQLCEALAPFVVCWQPRGLQAAFVVPPKMHVLVAVGAHGPHLVASLVVEDWNLLPRIQEFLLSLCTSS
ncbi:AP-5 complex subunit beta-1-like isoform X2 [Amblyomma americanum]